MSVAWPNGVQPPSFAILCIFCMYQPARQYSFSSVYTTKLVNIVFLLYVSPSLCHKAWQYCLSSLRTTKINKIVFLLYVSPIWLDNMVFFVCTTKRRDMIFLFFVSPSLSILFSSVCLTKLGNIVFLLHVPPSLAVLPFFCM